MSRQSQCKISSKGQVTVPIAVRKRLGVQAGDRIQFVSEKGRIVVKPVRSEENPFLRYVGVLSPNRSQPGGTAVAWTREMRDEDDSR